MPQAASVSVARVHACSQNPIPALAYFRVAISARVSPTVDVRQMPWKLWSFPCPASSRSGSSHGPAVPIFYCLLTLLMEFGFRIDIAAARARCKRAPGRQIFVHDILFTSLFPRFPQPLVRRWTGLSRAYAADESISRLPSLRIRQSSASHGDPEWLTGGRHHHGRIHDLTTRGSIKFIKYRKR